MPAAGCNLGTSGDSCVGSEGGVFDPLLSSTFHNTTQAHWNGTNDGYPSNGEFDFFNDRLNFGSAFLYGFPLILDPNSFGK